MNHAPVEGHVEREFIRDHLDHHGSVPNLTVRLDERHSYADWTRKEAGLRTPISAGVGYGNGTIWFSLACVAVTCLAVLLLATAVEAQGSPDSSDRAVFSRPFFKDSRAELALARVRGASEVTLIVASKVGQNAAVARKIARVGGSVRYRMDVVDYLRARVPITHLMELLAFNGVQVAEVSVSTADRRVVLLSDTPDADMREYVAAPLEPDTTLKPWPPQRSDLPLRRPYRPLPDIDAEEFRARNPTFDGRGVTIALLDGHVDLLLPELQWARTLDGTRTRKVVGLLNGSDPLDPLEENHAPQWVEMRERVTAHNGFFTYGGIRYETLRDGNFRLGWLNERQFDRRVLMGVLGGDLNRNGNPEGSDSLFAVLWDEGTSEVWVDTRQDRSFANESSMRDYSIASHVGTFGRDDPATLVRETLGFTVQTDLERGFVSINVGFDAHGTGVAGAALANGDTGGRFDGIAPEAQLVSIYQGRSIHGQIEAMILAFQHPGVDLVVLQPHVTLAYLLKDGRHTANLIYDRLVEVYSKPLVIPAGNQPGLSTVIEESLARSVVAVNAYQSRESFLINNGVRVAQRDNLHWVHSFGPGGDGRLKPDVIAPSNVLTANPGFLPGGSRSALYQLPPGYKIGNGTSMAAPVAAGAIALLISAAKQTDVMYDAERIRRALLYSARFIPSIDAYKQGNGLVQVAAAWEALKVMDRGEPLITIESRAPVSTVLSHWLERPHEGPGIFQREGWTAGLRDERTIHLTRSTGPEGRISFRINWLGNAKGTFSSVETLELPRDSAVALPIIIAPQSTGVHSAILSLEHPEGFAVHRVLNTIVAAEALEAASSYTIRRRGTVDRPGTTSHFLCVPSGAAALTIELAAARDVLQLWLYPPDARQSIIYLPDSRVHRRTIPNPMAGVWEVLVSDARDAWTFDEAPTALLPSTPMTVTASLVEAGVVPSALTLAVESHTKGWTLDLKVRNRYAPFTGGVAPVLIGSAFEARPTIANRQQQIYTIDVPAGSTMLRARINRSSNSDTDLDLYLFDCTGDRCVPRKSSIGDGSDEEVVITNPSRGIWKVVVDAAAVPSGQVSYSYLDVVFNPRWGGGVATDIVQERASDEAWKAAVHVWLAGMPDGGREPYGRIPVRGAGLEELTRRPASSSVNLLDNQIQPLDLGAAEVWFRPDAGDGSLNFPKLWHGTKQRSVPCP